MNPEVDFLEHSKVIISQIRNLSNDSEKVNVIVDYIEKINNVLSQYNTVASSLVEKQHKTLELFDTTTDSMSKLHDRIIAIERYLNTNTDYVEAHDVHLKMIDNCLTTHDNHLNLLSQRIDLI